MATATANGSTGAPAPVRARAAEIAAARAGGRAIDAVDVAVEEPGQSRPRHLDLGLEALDADDVEPDRRLDEPAHDLVDDRGLADARLTDERAGAAVAAGGAAGDVDELVDETLPTAQWCWTWPDERRRGRRSGRHRLQRRHRGGRPPAHGMVAGIGSRLPAPRRRAPRSVRGVGFTRAELESYRGRNGARPRRTRAPTADRRDQPRAVDGRRGDALRPPGQPLLPGDAARPA